MSAPIPAADWPPGHVCVDDLVVEGVLGTGGTAGVYRAFSPSRNIRFAVKRHRPGRRELAAAELERLLDLPDHPHLARCRMFRPLPDGGWALCFAWADGTDLASWRAGCRPDPPLAIDLAIQAGRAVAAVHELGWVHLDVKPRNLLLGTDGVVRLLDFGSCLPWRLRAGDAPPPAVPSTPAYRSPWHPPGGAPGPRADVWSWGLCVLELFAGRPACHRGTVAATALAAYVRDPAGGVPLPGPVADVLARCFDPTAGWPSLAEACAALIPAYEGASGTAYPRPVPAASAAAVPAARSSFRHRPPLRWADDLRAWLAAAEPAVATGDLDRARATAAPRAGTSSPRATALREVLAFGELERALLALPVRPPGWADRLAEMRLHKASAHEAAGDVAGAVATYEAVLAMAPDGPAAGPRWAADAHESLAGALVVGTDDAEAALMHYRRAVALYAALGPQAAPADRASVHVNHSIALRYAGQTKRAAAECRQGLALYESCAPADAPDGRRFELAATHLQMARLCRSLPRLRPRAAGHLATATGILEALVGDDFDSRFAPTLADCLVERSRWVRGPTPASGREPPFDGRAVAVYRRHVADLRATHWRSHLARAYCEQARRRALDGDDRGAAGLLADAASEYRELVCVDGEGGFRSEWAATLVRAAEAAAAAGDYARGLGQADDAVALLEALVDEGRSHARAALARGHALRARIRFDAGDGDPADDVRASYRVLREAAARGGEAADHEARKRVDALLRPLLRAGGRKEGTWRR